MSNNEQPQPRTAEELRKLRALTLDIMRSYGFGEMLHYTNSVLRFIDTLDAEWAQSAELKSRDDQQYGEAAEEANNYHRAAQEAGEQITILKQSNERLAAESEARMEAMRAVVEAAKRLDSAWIALYERRNAVTWERKYQASLAFWKLIADLEQPERSQSQAQEDPDV
jgi:hypothetical protein